MSLLRRLRNVRVRLTLWYVGAMLVVLAVYAGFVFVFVRSTLSDNLDARLRTEFEYPREMLVLTADGIMPADDSIEQDTDSPWLQIWSPEGRVIYRTWGARQIPIPRGNELASKADGSIVTVRETPPVRVLTGPSKISGQSVVIQVAMSEAVMHDEARKLLFILLLGMPLGAAAAGLGGYSLARRALAPVDRMAERAHLITAERLKDRLPVDNPNDELGKLATVFNETLTRLESSFDQMRRFTADASHELRTPLTAMRSVGEVGLLGTRSELEYREIIGSMLEEVDRLSNLVDRLLTMSRADMGEGVLTVDSVNLGSLAEDVVTQLDVLAEEKQQTLRVERTVSPLWTGDQLVLRQALLNLVDNAIKYTPPGGEITVRVTQSASEAILDVIDSGPGIPQELRGRIFDRFYRVDTARSRESGGTGLGLSIAKWAVEVNRGQLSLHHTSSAGSTFRITLPLASAALTERPQRPQLVSKEQ